MRKKAINAAILSGLVLPGLGQISMKKYVSGIFFLFLISISTLGFVYSIVKLSLGVLVELNKNDSDFGFDALINLSQNENFSSSMRILVSSLIVMIASWIISTIHAYIAGKKFDEENSGQTEKP